MWPIYWAGTEALVFDMFLDNGPNRLLKVYDLNRPDILRFSGIASSYPAVIFGMLLFLTGK
jgi:hypothetical protein